MFQTEAIQLQQGRRDIYLFGLTLTQIDDLLPSRSDDRLNTIQDANRALAPRHAANIRRYLSETENWVLGAITLAISPESIRYEDGTLTVTQDSEHPLRIIDGQHRRRAIANLLADPTTPDQYAGQSLAVCLYAEAELRNQRQMFASMAEQKPIDKTTRLEFDATDPFNNTARWAGECAPLLRDRINRNKGGTISTRDETLLAGGDVKDLVTILTLGYGGKVTQNLKKHHLQEQEQAKMRQQIADYCQLLTDARPELNEVASGQVPAAHLPIKRNDSWALDPAFLRLAAGCCYAWRQTSADTGPLRDTIAGLELSKSALLHDDLMAQLNLLNPQNGKLVSRSSPEWRNAIQTICQNASETATMGKAEN